MCNLEYFDRYEVPVFYHNGTDYDFHHIIRYLACYKTAFPDNRVLARSSVRRRRRERLSVILLLSFQEKFTSLQLRSPGKLTIGLKDSCRFLQAPLDTLVSNLYKLGETQGCQKQAFPHVYRYFQNVWAGKPDIPEDAFYLLLKKGYFPYKYFDNFKRFEETKLPEIEHFYNDLKEEDISQEDYKHACRVFETFKLKSFKEYHDLYLELDTVLLTDVFEQFRQSTLQEHKLDPAAYISLPG